MEHQRRIGRYQVLEELAAGGQATVFRAWDTTTGQVVALKVMHPHLVGDAAYLERFRREAGLAASISHPNVIRLFEVGQDGDSHYISMEYLALSVHDLIEAQGQLPIDRVADICRQTALALEAADKRGIVHRDIKPQNIMMAPDGTAKVSDFGIARASQLSTMTRTGALMGTPHYMAPEQAQGQRASVRSDIYSLGIVMYQMLTGKVPFEAETPWAVIRQHVETQPKDVRKLRSDVPKALGSLVTRCLEKDPDRRFQTPRELALAIEKAVPQISRPQPQQQPISSVRQSPPKIAPIPAPSQEPRAEPSGAAPSKGGFIMRTARRVIAAGVLIAFVVGVAASALPGGFLPGSPDDHESGPTTVAGQEEPGPVVSERPVVSQGPGEVAAEKPVAEREIEQPAPDQTRNLLSPPPAMDGASGSIVLVSDSSWKASDEQHPGWNEVGFDDSSWIGAEAPWEYWAGDISEADGMWYPGAHEIDAAWFFFRKGFSVSSLAGIARAELTVQVDDDYVLYVNGVEVARDENQFAGPPSTYDVLSHLTEGENVIAIMANDTVGGGEGVSVKLALVSAADLVQEVGPSPDTMLAQGILAASYEAMQGEVSFHFEGLGGQFRSGNSGEEMEWGFVGDYLAPDRSQGVSFQGTAAFDGQMEIVTIGGVTYARDPETGLWHEDEEAAMPIPHVTVEIEPSVVQDLVSLGRVTLDGRSLYHLEGAVPMRVLSTGETDGMEGWLRAEYWIDMEDSLLRRLTLEGEFPGGQDGAFRWTIRYSEFGKRVVIDAPELAAGSPGPDPSISPEAPANIKIFDGDWIIDGDESYEDTTIEVHGSVIVTGSGALRLDNSWLVLDAARLEGEAPAIDVRGGTLSLNRSNMQLNGAEDAGPQHQLVVSASGGSISFVDAQVPFSFILVADESDVHIERSNLDVPWTTIEMRGGELHLIDSKAFKVRLLDGSHEIVGSRLDRVDLQPASDLALVDSEVSVLTLELPHESRFLLKGLDESGDVAPRVSNLDTGEDTNLTLERSPIGGWSVVVNGGHVTIEDSSIVYMLSQNGSKVVLDNGHVRSWDIRDGAEVMDSRVDRLTFDSDAVAPIGISLYRTEIGTLKAAGPGGDGRVDVDIFCSECRIDEGIELSRGDIRIQGDIQILASPVSISWDSSTITRSYRVVLTDSSGEPIAGAPVGVVNATGSGEAVAEMLTDDDGEAVFALDFDDDTWREQYKLGAFVGGQVVEETLNFFSPSPVLLSTALSSSASDPILESADECYSVRSDGDSIERLSILPTPGTLLQAGTVVDVEVQVRYSLDSHETGRVIVWRLLLPTDEDEYSGGRAGFAEAEVSRGSGVIVVSGSFEVPDKGEMDIRVSLDPLSSAFQSAGFECWSSMASESAGEYPISDTVVSEPADSRPLVEVSGILVRAYVDGRSLLMISLRPVGRRLTPIRVRGGDGGGSNSPSRRIPETEYTTGLAGI